MAPERRKDPTCLMVRNRPQGADAMELAREAKAAFLGYPMIKQAALGNDPDAAFARETDLSSIIVNLKEHPHEAWEEEKREWNKADFGYSSRFPQTYRNMIFELKKGASVIACPRPTQGVIYLGRYTGYALKDDLGQDYFDLRKTQGECLKDPASHRRDVVQRLKVQSWKPVQLVAVPAWLRKSCFGRSAVARFSDIEGMSVFETLNALLKNDVAKDLSPLDAPNSHIVYKRLLAHCGPEPFEHLVTALLQLEEPELRWFQVGGSGDGGVDCLGVDTKGNTRTIVQCKWETSGVAPPKKIGGVSRTLAHLVPGDAVPKGEDTSGHGKWDEVLGGHEIADLVIKHRERLPFAASIGL